MELAPHWDAINATFGACLSSSKHCAIATVDKDGNPHITPMGFVFLRDDQTAYYFEEYTNAIPTNIQTNKNVCIMAVNSGFFYWLKSLLSGQFVSPPGIRLFGIAGERRPAKPGEIQAYKNRIGSARNLRGSKLIWQGLETVREIKLTAFKPVQYPQMMSHFWRDE